ncbi:Acid trehalase-like protein 1 [Intoshia linei]|uniref:Acid trehalase-like protein 1 n=1 Tax=Intoshia linei TaxID=1819745 RepID=A0A177BCT4_9BILA|nr:Acid trehalase-like protein 1 [Intoshia linei]
MKLIKICNITFFIIVFYFKSLILAQNENNFEDDYGASHIIKSSYLHRNKGPSNEINVDLMPILANGYIGGPMYGKWLNINGVYSYGENATSAIYKTRIPSLLMSSIQFEDEELLNESTKEYRFNTKYGIFNERVTNKFAIIEKKTYAHRKLTRLFVNEITIRRKPDSLTVGIINLAFVNYDIKGEDYEIEQNEYHKYHKMVRLRLKKPFSEKATYIHVFWKESPMSIHLSDGINVYRLTTFMSLDVDEARARQSFDQALNYLEGDIRANSIYNEHIKAWDTIWENGHLEFDDNNPALAQLVSATQYSLYSSLRSESDDQPPADDDYITNPAPNGFSMETILPDSLISWKNDLMILPALSMLQPEMARYMLRFRAEQAKDISKKIAIKNNQEGISFAFEMPPAYISPKIDNLYSLNGKNNAKKQYHISAAVVMAIRHYFAATWDLKIKSDQSYKSCDIIKEISRNFAQLLQRTSDNKYSLNDSIGPDETTTDQNLVNGYTNIITSISIQWARYFTCMCGETGSSLPLDWDEKAVNILLPYNKATRNHYRYIEKNQTAINYPDRIKELEILLIHYPFKWNVSNEIALNDIYMYGKKLIDHTESYNWSILTILHKWYNLIEMTQSNFEKSYVNYVKEPYKLWSQYPINSDKPGLSNYLPSAGGFIQSLLFGYAGIHLNDDNLECINPSLPIDSQQMKVRANYLGWKLDFTFTQEYIELKVNKSSNNQLQINYFKDSYINQKDSSSDINYDNEYENIPVTDGSKDSQNIYDENDFLEEGFNIKFNMKTFKKFKIYSPQGAMCESPQIYANLPCSYDYVEMKYEDIWRICSSTFKCLLNPIVYFVLITLYFVL